MEQISIGTSIKSFCGHCGGERNCEVKGVHIERGSDADGAFDWSVHWYLLVCRGCDFVFAQSVSSDSESYEDYYDYHGNPAREYYSRVETWPAKSKRKIPEWFKHNRVDGTASMTIKLNTALNELYRALDADLMVLSSIGIRTAFDAASEALEVEAGLPFEAKLKELLKDGKIRTSELEKLKVLIDAGSASAHRGWKPDAEQLNIQMDILEEFIFNSMVLPAREKMKAENIENLKKSVPQKKKAKKTKIQDAEI